MEHMDLHQPTNQNEEQEKLKLHTRDGEDDTSYPSAKRGKLDLDLPEEISATKDHQWFDFFDFRRFTSEPTQVYENMIIECKQEIEAVKKAYNETSKFFKVKFGKLTEKRPGCESSYVFEILSDVEQEAKRCLDVADEIFPTFKEDVENYVKYKNGPLSVLQVAENQYFNKIEELVEIPNVEKMIKGLLYNVEDDKKIEQRSGLTLRDLFCIINFLWSKKYICIPYRKENTMDEEPYVESEMEDLLIQHKDSLKELSSIRFAYEIAAANVKNHVEKHEHVVHDHVSSVEAYLGSANCKVRILRRQLGLLLQKDVIVNGYDSCFDDDWEMACRPGYNCQEV